MAKSCNFCSVEWMMSYINCCEIRDFSCKLSRQISLCTQNPLSKLLCPCCKTKMILQTCHISLKSLVVKILERKLPSRLSLKMHCFAHTLLFSIHHCIDFKHYKEH